MKTATRLLALALLVVSAGASAQVPTVTVREAQSVSQANIDQLIALGANATATEVDNLTVPERNGETVRFTAVVLSNPYVSGNATWVPATNRPGRIHVFVRDTSAVGQGYEGMTTQFVDGSGLVQDWRVGRVYTIEAQVTVFNAGGAGQTIQMVPVAAEDLGPYQALGLPDAIMEPVTITTDQLTTVVNTPEGVRVHANWANFNDLNHQYVRFEDALVTDVAVGTNERVNYQWRSSGTEALVNSGDISLRFRNDKDGQYPDSMAGSWQTRPASNPFIPPAIGATIDVQGFAVFPTFDFSNDGRPASAFFSVHPMVDSDLEVTASPPVFGQIQFPEGIPGNAPVTISVEVTPSPGRTLTSVVANYQVVGGASGQVTLTDGGSGVYSGDIPTAPDGAFVTVTVTATDSEGASSTTPARTYRVLYSGIASIEHIQRTVDGQPGGSPFVNYEGPMNIDAVVQADFVADNGRRYVILQDDADLAPWSGIWAEFPLETVLTLGDRLLIDGAQIVENFSVTELRNVTFTNNGLGAPYPHKVVPTALLNGDDPGTQEAHEGMLLRFEPAVITDVNADGPDDGSSSNFGEWQFSNTGDPASEVRADDFSDAFGPTFNIDNFAIGQARAYIQGVWYFSFSNYKLIPIAAGDVGGIITSNEPVGEAAPGAFRLHGAYPNPFNPATTIRYEVGTAGPVALRVYDVTGREVATLVNETLAPASYEATFDARGLASGVYVYRLTAGGQVLTGRVTLVK